MAFQINVNLFDFMFLLVNHGKLKFCVLYEQAPLKTQMQLLLKKNI